MMHQTSDDHSATTTPVEDRYRRLLRLLPPSYRAAWEEDMVATFLDSIHRDDPEEAEYLAYCGRPSRAEALSVVRLAVRLRLGGAESPPRSFLWGEAVRRVALVGLLVHAVGATIGIAQELWLAGIPPWPPLPAEVVALADGRAPTLGDIAWNAMWIAAYLALLLGNHRTAKVLAGAALLPMVVTTAHSTLNAAVGRPPASSLVVTLWAELALTAVAVLALAAFHGGAPAPRHRPWLIAYLAGLPLVALLTLAWLVQPARAHQLVDRPGLWALTVVVAALIHLSRGTPGSTVASRPATWSLTLALLAGGVLGLRIASLVDYALADTAWVDGTTMVVGLLQALALTAVGVPLARRVGRALRVTSEPGASPHRASIGRPTAPW